MSEEMKMDFENNYKVLDWAADEKYKKVFKNFLFCMEAGRTLYEEEAATEDF